MGFYDQAYKNIGNQAGYAAATVGAYLFHNYRKDKAQAAKQNVKEEIEAKDVQMKDFETRYNQLENAYNEQTNLLVNTNQELNNYKDATAKAIKMIGGMLK